MPRTKVGGLRSVGQPAVAPTTALPGTKKGKFQYCSRNAGYFLSLRRRRFETDRDGVRVEVAPRSKDDTPLDWVKFEDNYFETTDEELAKLIEASPRYGLPSEGGEVWSLEAQTKASEAAREAELRRQIAELPSHVRERVLRPSDSEDISVPQQ